MQLRIRPDGLAYCVYDELIDLATVGLLSIKRASHLEPTADGHWIADMSPSDGPALGPYACRSEALAAEQAWLSQNWLSNNPHASSPK